MFNKEEEFRKRIHETFRIEAEEHLNAFSAGLIALEKMQPMDKHAEIIETMFREIHSLKGAARSVDQKEIESVCHPLESIFSALKRKELSLTALSLDLFYKTIEWIKILIADGVLEQTATKRIFQRELIIKLKETAAGNFITDERKEYTKTEKILIPETQSLPVIAHEVEVDIPISIKPPTTDTVRIRTSILEPLLLQAEELIQAKKTIQQHTYELQAINNWVSEWKSESLKYKEHQSVALPSSMQEWKTKNETNLNKLENQLIELAGSMRKDQYILNSLIDSHLKAMKQILMLPVASMVEVFPGMVHKISHEQNKEIKFIVQGSELEIDKRILEELKDPLVHLIRNCIDHGIGTPQERILLNKPAIGNITLSFTALESGMIGITISDDGKGINRDNLLKAAIKSGALTIEEAEKLDVKEILPLIYQSGVSTSSFITDISGRGLGLSIVHEKVEKLNGKISVESEVNKGTTFQIILPMTISTFRGVLVNVDEFQFIIPTLNVERVLKVDAEKIKTVANHQTVEIDSEILSLADLGAVLGLPAHKHVWAGNPKSEHAFSKQIQIAVLVSGVHRIAFMVDEVIDEQQVLVKSLGKLLIRVKNISSATILGSGKIVPVLHIPDLMKSAFKLSETAKVPMSSIPKIDMKKKILVTDDSITSRALIKNILETAGYQVTTAVDGMDAYTKARSDEFDLVVSDVDMPRLNGFELTAKLRQDKKLSEIPLILITALGSQEDRERGMEVGADAYIIKSNFDQTNLIEIIKKLI